MLKQFIGCAFREEEEMLSQRVSAILGRGTSDKNKKSLKHNLILTISCILIIS